VPETGLMAGDADNATRISQSRNADGRVIVIKL
jgi:hypothetical protein